MPSTEKSTEEIIIADADAEAAYHALALAVQLHADLCAEAAEELARGQRQARPLAPYLTLCEERNAAARGVSAAAAAYARARAEAIARATSEKPVSARGVGVIVFLDSRGREPREDAPLDWRMEGSWLPGGAVPVLAVGQDGARAWLATHEGVIEAAEAVLAEAVATLDTFGHFVAGAQPAAAQGEQP